MKQVKLLVLIAACLAGGIASAGPAWRGVITLSQPDGAVLQARLSGDEAAHVMTDLDGRALIQDGDGFWCYALYSPDGSVHSSGEIAGRPRKAHIMNAGAYIPYAALNLKSAEHRRQMLMAHKVMDEDAAPVNKRSCIIILAQFKDLKMTCTRENFSRLLNGGNQSAKKYFTDQFLGECEFSFEIGPLVTLSRTQAYYGHNENGSDANAAEAVAEACTLAAAEGVDFSRFDDDGDGTVDNVFIFMAGKDEADGGGDNAIWSHSWYLEKAGIPLTLGGKKIDRYAVCSELGRARDGKFRIAGIGTFCHEYSHVLGLADMYNTEVRSPEGRTGYLWGTTSIMDNGNRNNDGRTPPYYNAIERDMLGIGSPEALTPGHYVLEPINGSGRFLRYDTSNEGEYYLVECRAMTGWDMFAGGRGLAIYHIDKSASDAGYSKVYDRNVTAAERWSSNEVNSNSEHECADMMEASPDATDASQVFFPYGRNNEFSPTSVPSFTLWDGSSAPLAIKDIMIAGNNVEFNVVNVASALPPQAVDVKCQVFQDAAILQWASDAPDVPAAARVTWGETGGAGSVSEIASYGDGRYSLRLEGLRPLTSYKVSIVYEADGVKGKEANVTFVTKRLYADGYPFIYLNDIERNADLSFKSGTMIPLIVFNLNNAKAVEWLRDGHPIVPDSSGYFQVDRSCVITAHVTYMDGATDIIEKKMIVR